MQGGLSVLPFEKTASGILGSAQGQLKTRSGIRELVPVILEGYQRTLNCWYP